MKTVLNDVISNTQNGFLDGRYIGESTRMVYDTIQYCEETNIDGLLLLIDFEKAFDSVSWDFLYKTLDFFNFGSDIKSWIQLFNNEVIAYISQCGFLSDKIHIKRGCRQGDPIASYEFLLCAEILSILIKNNHDITGIIIADIEYKMTQFADDTTILLDGSQTSLTSSLNTLEVFGSISGLKMNCDKTKVIWIGRKKYCKDKLLSKYNLLWGEEEFDLLGLTFNVDVHLTTQKNYQKAIVKIKANIHSWNKRYLTPLGKITVIKTFLLSQLNHLFIALPNPPPETLKEINTILYKFLWDNKPDKIKRINSTLPYSKGGINMINIENFIAALKITWIRRLFSSTMTPTKTLFESLISPINKIHTLGSQYIQSKLNNIKNKFWYDTLSSWVKLCSQLKPRNYQELCSNPIWYNPLVSDDPLFLPYLYKKGINIIGDMLNNEGGIISKHDLSNKTGIPSINDLHYLRLKMSIKQLLQLYNYEPTHLQRPVAPLYYTLTKRNPKGSKDFYNILIQPQNTIIKTTWEVSLGTDIPIKNWNQIYRACFHSIKDNYLIWLQFKIINKILGTRALLHKMSIIDNPSCSFCNQQSEDLPHLFFECEQVLQLWNTLYNWIFTRTGIRFVPTKLAIILGQTYPYRNVIQINTINMITKSYIFYTSRKKNRLNIYQLQMRIKTSLLNLEFTAIKNNDLHKFTQIWNPFKELFDEN